MRKGSFIFIKFLAVSLLSFTFAACEENKTESKNTNQAINNIAGKTDSTNSTGENTDQTEKKDHHEHKAPHNGTLIAFGDEFAHLEIVVDSEKGEITGYTLDGEAEKSVLIAQEFIEIEIDKPNKLDLKLEAVQNSLTGEKRGATSEFRAVNEKLKDMKSFDGEIKSITIRGKEFKNIHFNFPNGNEEKNSTKTEEKHSH